LSLIGTIIFIAYRYKWIMSFTTLLSLVFVCVNIFKPEIHGENLMPALQSPWFVPHVIVYMIAYALMGAARNIRRLPLAP
jgi:ABC-type transport system involved in cytochrome c biogenesis permease subunit